MSEYNRHFARRHITWKLTNVTRESLKNRRDSPKFSISLGDNKMSWVIKDERKKDIKIEWFFGLRAESERLVVDLWCTQIERAAREKFRNFSFKISAAFPKMKPISTFGCFERAFRGSDYDLYADFHSRGNLVPLDVLFDEKNELLDGTDLTLELQLELMEKPKVKVTLEANPVCDNFEKLINSEKYSDFEFICSDGESIHVHKAIIAAQCEAFAKMVEAGMSESKTNSAKITDVDSETMTELVRFLYCRRVENMEEVQERLVIAANKYRLEDLKNLCVSSLMESLTVENVVDVFGIAELLGEEHLKNNCIDFIKCHHIQLQDEIEEDDFPKKVLWTLWKSIDSHPIRIWFENGGNM